MHTSRSTITVIFVCSIFASLAASGVRAQMVAHYRVNEAGGLIAGLGDLNGDGHADFVVPLGTGPSLGALSGIDRSQLWQIPMPLQVGSSYGYYSMDNAGDVDGDGRDDLVLGCTTCDPAGINVGSVHVYSGATQVELYEWFGAHPGANFGAEVSAAGDVDGDGYADIAATSVPSQWPPPPSYVDVYSGATGTLLHRFTSPTPNSGFGDSIAAAGDVDADGFDDIVIGALVNHLPGHAYVFSGASGALLHDFAGAPNANLFGIACGVGDVDADGFDDVAVSALEEVLAAGPYGALGRVYVFSGQTGALLWSTDGIWNHFRFGWPLKRLGDLDGDVVGELLASAYWQGPNLSRLAILSGRTGAIIADIDPKLLAFDIADLGDMNADGFDDFGATGLPTGHGAVAYGIFLGNVPAPATYCSAKTNSAGCVPQIIAGGTGPSVSVGDDVSVGAHSVVTGVHGALVWSLSQASTPFAGGTLCLGQNNTVFAVSSSGYWYGYPGYGCFGQYGFTLPRTYLLNQGLSAGTTLYAQIISRDPGFAWPDNVGLTDALAIVIAP